jgi:TolB-like protein
MKQRYRVILSWLIVCAALWGVIPEYSSAQTENGTTVAVMNFDNNSVVDHEKLDPLKKGLADMLITELSKINGLKVVQRSQAQSVVDELNLSASDLGGKNASQKLGRLLGAKVILFGGFSNLFGDKLRIDTRLVSTETGITLKTEEETGALDEFSFLLNALVHDVAKDLEVKLSSADENHLRPPQGGKFSGYVTYAQGVSMEDSAQALLRNGNQSDALAMYENARTTYQKAYTESNGYQPAKQKADEMGQIIAQLKKDSK